MEQGLSSSFVSSSSPSASFRQQVSPDPLPTRRALVAPPWVQCGESLPLTMLPPTEAQLVLMLGLSPVQAAPGC